MAISSALALAWEAAAAEAVRSKYEFIEPPHLLIGICSVEKWVGHVDETIRRCVSEEATAVVGALKPFSILPGTLRREIRQALREGTQDSLAQNGVVHRSLASKAAFLRAAGLVAQPTEGAKIMSVLHLLAALANGEEGPVTTIWNEHGIDPAALRRSALVAAGTLKICAAHAPAAHKSVLASFGRDLVSLAREGEIEECVGRGDEMLRMIQILGGGGRNNPLLVGDPGVGKTALVEGLAWRIAHNKDDVMNGRRVIQVSLTALLAGTRYRGDIEQRVEQLTREMAAAPELILFIDEIHGSSSPQQDILGMLKPALAQDQFRCIGATTWEGYRQVIEKDSALERRFQKIEVEEPSLQTTRRIVETSRKRLESKHRVQIEDSAIDSAISLSARYLFDRRFPDKALSLLDEACSRIAIPKLGSAASEVGARLVDREAVAQVLAAWGKIPVAQVRGDERQWLLGMAKALRARVIGQDGACEKVAAMVQRARAGLKEASRPVAVLLFLGPTGVGKTELAKATAEFLFGGDSALIRLDMSEYMEKHSVSRLTGAPPGFVGHDEDPQLTTALRRKPHCVVLIDEVEKAHPDVLNLFLQLFDEGRLTDAHGRTAHASESIFILTSNLALGEDNTIIGFHQPGRGAQKDSEADVRAALRHAFRPEMLNRFDAVISFNALALGDLREIALMMLENLRQKLKMRGIILDVRPEAVEFLAEAGFTDGSNARALRRIVEQQIEGHVSGMLLAGKFTPGDSLILGAANSALTFVRNATTTA